MCAAISTFKEWRHQYEVTRLSLLSLTALALTCVAVCAQAQTFTKLYDFCNQTNSEGFCLDGQYPGGNLVQGTDGNLYGVTVLGGSSGSGMVFRITPAGKLTTVYSFCSPVSCSDGSYPSGGLLLGSDGNFYGITEEGGVYGNGSIFKLTAAGKLTTLHSFDDTDGNGNSAPALIQAANGNFYGTTVGGGISDKGTAFEITAGGTFTTLYSFCASSGCPDGSGPNGLMQGADGNFYGTTSSGGESSDCSAGNTSGTFFQLTAAGKLTTLDVFCAPTGYRPNSPLVQAANGNFYGTTGAGGDGTKVGYGTVYEMTSAGALTSLHSFCLESGCADGKNPQPPILGTDGNLYGTVNYGGANGARGTVYEITPAGQLTTLYSFTSTNGNFGNGSSPTGALVLHTDGTFYGTANAGGKHTDGTFFSLATGLAPFVKTNPTSGAEGTNVIILGTNLGAATAVSFNGTAAKFTVVSASEITTTVPGGATSGTVTVTTGGKKLKSNVTFQIP